LLKTRPFPRFPRFVLVTTALVTSLLLLACGGVNDVPKQQDGITVEVADGALPTQVPPQAQVAPNVQAPASDSAATDSFATVRR